MILVLSGKVWTPEEIWSKISTDTLWLKGALVAIYSHQTIKEKKKKAVLSRNGMGFKKGDAEFLSRVAELIIKGTWLERSDWLEIRPRMKKYCKQLAKIANKPVFYPIYEIQKPNERRERWTVY